MIDDEHSNRIFSKPNWKLKLFEKTEPKMSLRLKDGHLAELRKTIVLACDNVGLRVDLLIKSQIAIAH